MRWPALLAALCMARSALAVEIAGPYDPANSTLAPAKLDPVVGTVAEAKLLLGKTTTWNGKFNPPAGIVCYVDPSSGIVTGVDDGTGGRCGAVNGTAVELPLPEGRFVKAVDMGVVPGTDLIGRLTFHVSNYNASKLAPPSTSFTCGNASKVVMLYGGGASAALPAAVEAATDPAGLSWFASLKNKTSWLSKPTAASSAHLAAIRFHKCITDRLAPALLTVPNLKNSTKVQALEQAAADALSLANPRVSLPSALDPASLELVYTGRTCKRAIECVPGSMVTIEESGCVPSGLGYTWIFVANGVPATTVTCPPPGQSVDIKYQELTPGESPTCVTSGTCTEPAEDPAVDNPDAARLTGLVGAECVINGQTQTCHSDAAGCPAGLVVVPDEAGTCVEGVCCDTPTPPAPAGRNSPPPPPVDPVCAAGLQSCASGCVNTATSPSNCGACERQCALPHTAAYTCAGGLCAAAGCSSLYGDCDGNPANGCETPLAADLQNCGACGALCPVSGSVCAGGVCSCPQAAPTACPDVTDANLLVCTNTQTDANNCAACGTACGVVNGDGNCTAGVCGVASCDYNYANCNGNAADGCETDLSVDVNNCGACGTVCSQGQTCVAGQCFTPPQQCTSGRAHCSVNPADYCEVDTNTDDANCGSCGNACSNAQTCLAGTCTATCPAGQSLCSGGCVDLQNDSQSCGTCGTVCSGGSTCVAGQCACQNGQQLCGGVCVSQSSDPANCGGCGVTCAAGQACTLGVCQLTCSGTGKQLCSGSCIQTLTDNNNCGLCGNVCPSGSSCSNGGCICIANGVTHPISGSLQTSNSLVPLSTTQPGGIGCQYQTLNTKTFNLGTPTRVAGGSQPAFCTLIYNSFGIPDRYILHASSPCGPIIADTSYTGTYSSGCVASAPCCKASDGQQCLGPVPTAVAPNLERACPRTSSNSPGVTQTNQNGFYPGPGKMTIPIGNAASQQSPTEDMWISVFGVCSGTGNSFAQVCCPVLGPDGHCPYTGQPATYNASYTPSNGSLAYVPNGTGCKVVGQTLQPNTNADGNCATCRLTT